MSKTEVGQTDGDVTLRVEAEDITDDTIYVLEKTVRSGSGGGEGGYEVWVDRVTLTHQQARFVVGAFTSLMVI